MKLIKTVQSLPKIFGFKYCPFALVESKVCPSDRSRLKQQFAEGETLDNAFAGGSVKDCQDWLLAHHDTVKFIEPNIIGVADARTAKDGTILMSWYYDYEGERVDHPPYGLLPPRIGEFWDFRVLSEQANQVVGDLNFTGLDAYPYYFGCPEDSTDENGVFHPERV